ncbi:unnamed protein product, partial [Hapterophycus canaliculatus]
ANVSFGSRGHKAIKSKCQLCSCKCLRIAIDKLGVWGALGDGCALPLPPSSITNGIPGRGLERSTGEVNIRTSVFLAQSVYCQFIVVSLVYFCAADVAKN